MLGFPGAFDRCIDDSPAGTCGKGFRSGWHERPANRDEVRGDEKAAATDGERWSTNGISGVANGSGGRGERRLDSAERGDGTANRIVRDAGGLLFSEWQKHFRIDPVARAYPLSDLVKLVRAYGLLAGTSDTERVIAGPLSRRWIETEVEHFVPLSALPEALFRTQRGRELLAAEFFTRHDIDPELIRPETLDIAGAPIEINTNRLPKFEPIIHQAVLAANMLLGVRLYGNGGRGMVSVSHDLIVATMLQDVLGKAHPLQRHQRRGSRDRRPHLRVHLVRQRGGHAGAGPRRRARALRGGDGARRLAARGADDRRSRRPSPRSWRAACA